MLQKNNKEDLPFISRLAFKITELIFKYPNKTFHLRGIAKETCFSTTSVSRTITELEKFDIVVLEKTDITTNIRANLNSNTYAFYKRIFNLYLL